MRTSRLSSHAKRQYEQIAADQESDRLTFRLETLKIKIEKFLDLSKVRPLSESEQIELRSLEREQAALLARLSSKG